MSQLPPPPLPPFGDDTDEALTAFLDGELSAFASEHGTTAAEARDRLEQWPGFADRVAELEHARAAVAAPVPALDDLTRRRLVRTALPAAPGRAPSARRGARSWLMLVAAAAAVLLVVGLGALVVRSGDDGSGGTASKASTGAPRPREGDLGDVGDVSTPAALRALLDPHGESARAATRDAAGGSAADSAAPAPPPAGAPDATACAARLAGSRPVRFVGRGTYRGRAVVVVGITQGTRTIAFVVPADDCSTVLTSVSR